MNLWIGGRRTSASAVALRLDDVAPRAPVEAVLRQAAAFAGLEVTRVDGGLLVAREGRIEVHDGLLEVAEDAGGSALVCAVEGVLVGLRPMAIDLVADDLPDDPEAPGFPYPDRAGAFLQSVHRERSRLQTVEVCIHPVYGRVLLLDGETRLAASDGDEACDALLARSVDHAHRAALLGAPSAAMVPWLLARNVGEVAVVEEDHVVLRALEAYFPEAGAVRRDDRQVRLVLDRFDDFLSSASGLDLVVRDRPLRDLDEDELDAFAAEASAALGAGGRLVARVAPSAEAALVDRAVTRLQERFAEVRTWVVEIASLREPWTVAEGSCPR